MNIQTPERSNDEPRRRGSYGGSILPQPSSIPRVRSTIAYSRAVNSQPSFNFLTGEPIPSFSTSSSADRMRKSLAYLPTAETAREVPLEDDDDRKRRKKELEDLRAENKALRYTIDNHKQEVELASLRHEDELREATRMAQDDFKKMQAAEIERSQAARQVEALQKEISELQNTTSHEKARAEKESRETAEAMRLLEEEVEDLKIERQEGDRSFGRRFTEMETRNESLQQMVGELQHDLDEKGALLQDLQQQLADKGDTCGKLEAEVLRLKAQTGDTDTLNIIKRELSEQVSHIKKLEVTNRELSAELKHFKRIHKGVEVVEEEKRSLQRRLQAIEGLENELGEARIQRQRLEDERLAWTTYLQSQAEIGGEIEFESPEELARALVAERLQTATLVERVGALEPEISTRDSIIQDLEKQKTSLLEQIEKFSTTAASNNTNKVFLRLERQRVLAIKEAEYLRAQLRTYETEENTFQPETLDETKSKRISELEELVEQYRQELQTLHDEMATKDPEPKTPSHKRKHVDSAENDHQENMARKIRNLQGEYQALQNNYMLLEKDLSVTQERLKAASHQSKVRVLSLRANPTSDFEAIKLKTLTTLRQENADLQAQLRMSPTDISRVPMSSLAAAQLEIDAAQKALASEKTRNDRLMKVWGAKSTEFRQMVISLLGWDVVFMRDGKTRLTSFFYPSHEDDENSIVFDGEKGTMKVSGGPTSAFALKIGDQIRFWCKERGSIPCFLAALTLEFWEEKYGDRTLRAVP
ncbi:hypothetical protein K3495_g5298 [Podosphaera aphanis]|nr:hypothetical protein K3495_g5298 [Podosphaera aphanis]